MPQRILRPGIRTSKRFARVGWFEQSLYLRLMTMVDDYGRYEADPELIRSEAFPFGDPAGKFLQVSAVDSGLLALVGADLITIYEVEDKRYLQLARWQERARSESKYPAPVAGKCQQMTADVVKCLPPKPSPSPSPEPEPKSASAPRFTREQVDFEAQRCGLPESEAEKLWNYYSANGWKVGKNPVKSLPHLVAGWNARYRESNHRSSTSPTPGSTVSDRIERGNELRIVTERIKVMKGHISRDPFDEPMWKPGQREEWNKLIARKKELEQQIVKV